MKERAILADACLPVTKRLFNRYATFKGNFSECRNSYGNKSNKLISNFSISSKRYKNSGSNFNGSNNDTLGALSATTTLHADVVTGCMWFCRLVSCVSNNCFASAVTRRVRENEQLVSLFVRLSST